MCREPPQLIQGWSGHHARMAFSTRVNHGRAVDGMGRSHEPAYFHGIGSPKDIDISLADDRVGPVYRDARICTWVRKKIMQNHHLLSQWLKRGRGPRWGVRTGVRLVLLILLAVVVAFTVGDAPPATAASRVPAKPA